MTLRELVDQWKAKAEEWHQKTVSDYAKGTDAWHYWTGRVDALKWAIKDLEKDMRGD